MLTDARSANVKSANAQPLQEACVDGDTQNLQPRFLPLAAMTVVCHTVTYVFMGLLAMHFLHYKELLSAPNSGMRHLDDPLVMLGPSLQLIRGMVFASVFYAFRDKLFGRRHGWLLMAWLLIGIGILGTFAAPAGSLEGYIYTTIPILAQMRGYLEIVPQALLLSALLCYWVNHPGKKWMNWTLDVLFIICAGLPILGSLAQKR